MEVKINNEEKNITAELAGRLDTAAAQVFATSIQPLIDNADKTIILNCKDLEFISSSGLRLFLSLRKAAVAKGGKVIISNIKSEIKQVFTITGFMSLFEFLDN